ncbi:hypothetical protein PF008_g27944 [Phytophthora fragariae]|uniref:Tc1-like transposase DDE domain-containing protein n=1 Tax=Phytophthora fragariae TaxID=53985 RepID=A0A6G0QCR3_9STRA|nr:hypothetical protein PF008_g27944 [Phytophthora fragariae]
MAPGRPRTLPSSLPRLAPEVALDPDLAHVNLQSRQAILRERLKRKRQQRQEQVAEQHARQRSKRKIEELTMVYEKAQLDSEKTEKALERLERKRAQQKCELEQLRLAVEGGEHEATAPEESQLRRIAGYGKKKPRLSEADHAEIEELAGTMTQVEIAARIGAAQSTVSRHVQRKPVRSSKTGRKVKLTNEMLFAAARFQFLFNTTSLKRTCAFIELAFGVAVHPRTVSRRLKDQAGFRLGDFRRFPRDRNSERAIEDRYVYATTMPQKYGQNTLYEAVCFDEMKLSRCTKRKAWSIRGWIPTVPDEPYSTNPEHLTLLYAASPSFGTLYFEIIEGSVTGESCLSFMKEMMATYMRKGLASRKRAFIMDNASIHHRDIVTDYLQGGVVAEKIGLEFLPVYSPFLNPLEEVFGLLKSRLWRARSDSPVTGESKSQLKRSLSEQVLRVTNDDVRQFYFHVEHFLKFSEDRTPVFTQQLYEPSHRGDDAGLCPMLPETLERLLDSYLPHRYAEFTPKAQPDVEESYGCKRLTMEMIEAIEARQYVGVASDSNTATDASSVTEFNF